MLQRNSRKELGGPNLTHGFNVPDYNSGISKRPGREVG
jgi:hypothetical protein